MPADAALDGAEAETQEQLPVRETPTPVVLEAVATPTVDAGGRAGPVELPVPPGAGAIAVRFRAPEYSGPPGSLCFLAEQVDAGGTPWVGPAAAQTSGFYCAECTQRVYLGHDLSVVVFPNDGDALPPVESLSLSVSLRDCATRLPAGPPLNVLPASVLVEAAFWDPPPIDLPGTLRIRVVVASTGVVATADPAADPMLGGAVEAAAALFASAGLTVAMGSAMRIASPGPTLTFGPGDRAALDALAGAARDAVPAFDPAGEVLVVVGPCLRWEDKIYGAHQNLAGAVPRIPCGLGVEGPAEAVFLQGEACGGIDPLPWTDAAKLGWGLAHELGHYLGLYHVAEKDGQEDHLADTAPGDPNVMALLPPPEPASFSPRQARVIRAHPVVRFAR